MKREVCAIFISLFLLICTFDAAYGAFSTADMEGEWNVHSLYRYKNMDVDQTVEAWQEYDDFFSDVIVKFRYYDLSTESWIESSVTFHEGIYEWTISDLNVQDNVVSWKAYSRITSRNCWAMASMSGCFPRFC